MMPAPDTTAILVVAQHQLAGEAIRRELRYAGGCFVAGCVAAPSSCTAAVTSARPDVVVIVDCEEPCWTLARIRDASGAGPRAKIVVLTDRMDPRWLAELGDAGVDAAIARTIHAESLGAFLREVACGNAFHTFDPAPRREAGRAIAPIAREPLDLFGRHRPAGMPRRPQAPQRTHVNRLPSSRTAMRLAGKAA